MSGERAPRLALVTTTYARDEARCRLLVETVRRAVPQTVRHYLLVSAADRARFADLSDGRTVLVEAESLLPSWIHPPGPSNPSNSSSPGFWHSDRGGPFPGWTAQQLLKLSVLDAIDEDVALCCDSDVAFVRPFDPSAEMVSGTKVAFLRVPFDGPEQRAWHRRAAGILGVRADEPITYVGNLIPFRREVLEALRGRIRSLCGASWQQVFLRADTTAEYALYGVFVEHVLGIEAAGHTVLDHELVAHNWGAPFTSIDEVQAFFGRLRPHHAAVMVNAMDGTDVTLYADIVGELLTANGC